MRVLRQGLRAVSKGWRYLYGENPLHLLVLLGCFALVGYVVSMLVEDPSAVWLLVWFLGAVIGHDLVMYPLYALADQPLTVSRWARRKIFPRHPPAVPVINHIRLPVLGAGVLGLIYLPTITEHGGESFAFAAGHPLAGQYDNWLLITGLLFLGSAVIYAARLGAAAGTAAVRWRRRRAAAADAAATDAAATDAAAADAAAADADDADLPATTTEPFPRPADATTPD